MCHNEFEVIGMAEKNTCKTCGYYLQHYIFVSGGYKEVYLGHCTHPRRTKRCRPDSEACAAWIPQSDKYREQYVPNLEREDEFIVEACYHIHKFRKVDEGQE